MLLNKNLPPGYTFCIFFLQFENGDTKKHAQAETSFGEDLCLLQSKVKCTQKTVLEIIELFQKHTGLRCSKNLAAVDKKMQQAAGCSFLRLNGCPTCGKHVYTQGDESTTCPRVNEDNEVCGQARYDEQGKPFEVLVVLIYFVKCLFVL